MGTAIDLKYAMRVANGEERAKSPMEEAEIVDTLFHQRLQALKIKGKVEGYTQWQIRDAMEDILRAQDHTPAFKEAVENISCRLSGKGQPDAAGSDFFARLVHWDKLMPKQRLAVAGTFTNYMSELFHAELPKEDRFHMTCCSFMVMPSRVDLDLTTGKVTPARDLAQLCRNPNDDTHYFMRLNNKAAGFNDPVQVMASLFKSGIEGFELYLAGRKVSGLEVPERMEEDAERVAGLSRYHVFDYAACMGEDVTLPERFSHAQADKLAAGLRALLQDKGGNVPPPAPEPTLVQRIGNAFGLTMH